MVNLSSRQTIIVIAVVAIIAVIVVMVSLGFRGGGSSQIVSLKVWGTDPADAWSDVLGRYQAARPNATVEYTEIGAANYKNTLLNALAAGQGPDIFYIGNREVLMEADKIVPVGQTQFDLLRMRELFPVAVEQDFVYRGRIYALPLYIDTMVMIYNRDLYDQAGIAVPPATWDEFLRLIPQLRRIGGSGEIERAAASIGGSERSVNSGVDLLNLLMMQNGAQMTQDRERESISAVFASGPSGTHGYRAFDFYLNFANAASPHYTWNDSLPNSLEAFARGKTATIFNYWSAISEIRRISPFLRIGTAPMLQVAGSQSEISYARYDGLAVSRQSRVSGWAWDFIIFASTNGGAARSYANATGRIPAMRTLIAEKIADIDLSTFAKQALTARSWLHPAGDATAIINSGIEAVLTGRTNSAAALKQAEGQITQLYPK